MMKINKWWKKTLAVLGIICMIYVGGLVAAGLFLSIMNKTLTIAFFSDPGAVIIQTLLYGFIVYFCYKGISKIINSWKKSKK